MTRTLYPGKVEPILTPAQRPEQVTESRWHQPWSEPTVKSRPFLAAMQPFLAFDPILIAAPTGTGDMWYPSWSGISRRVILIGAG